MRPNVELSDFLRSSRARLLPEDLGLPADRLGAGATGRRVPGLRREEVARAAGVSVDYYIRLEQGRTRQVGQSVQNAIADALRLNEVEREYFFGLVSAQVAPLNTHRPSPTQRVRPGVRRIVDGYEDGAAFVIGSGMTVLAMNPMAKALLFDPDAVDDRDRNLARWTFLHPDARERYLDWEAVASDAAAILRRDVGVSPDEPALAALIGELTIKSDDFRRMWQEHKVFTCTFGSKRLAHPIVGRIDVDYEAFDVPGSHGQKLFLYTTQPGSKSSEAIALLESWNAPETAHEGNPELHDR